MSTDLPRDDERPPDREPLPEELQQALAGLITSGGVGPEGVEILTTPEHIIPALTALAQQLDRPYDMLTDICGLDLGDDLQVVYRLYRRHATESAVVKVTVPRGAPRVPTATALWKIANWPEREIAEMFGIAFEGHPDPRPLLLSEDIEGFPLRKDYQYREDHPYLTRDPRREDLAAGAEQRPQDIAAQNQSRSAGS